MDQLVTNNAIQNLLQIEENQKCFDCQQPDSSWASYINGVFLCIKCSTIHKGYSQQISTVLSIDTDEWTESQLKCMELGGNKAFRQFLDGYPFLNNTTMDQKYRSVAAIYYREHLQSRVHGDAMEHKQNPPSQEEGIKILDTLSFSKINPIQDPRLLLKDGNDEQLDKIKNYFKNTFEKTKLSAEREAARVQEKIASTDFSQELKTLGQKIEEKSKDLKGSIQESSKLAAEKTKEIAGKTKQVANEQFVKSKQIADDLAVKTKQAASSGFSFLKKNVDSTWSFFKQKVLDQPPVNATAQKDDDILNNEEKYRL